VLVDARALARASHRSAQRALALATCNVAGPCRSVVANFSAENRPAACNSPAQEELIMKKLLTLLTTVFALSIASAGCHAGGRVGPVHGGGGISSR